MVVEALARLGFASAAALHRASAAAAPTSPATPPITGLLAVTDNGADGAAHAGGEPGAGAVAEGGEAEEVEADATGAAKRMPASRDCDLERWRRLEDELRRATARLSVLRQHVGALCAAAAREAGEGDERTGGWVLARAALSMFNCLPARRPQYTQLPRGVPAVSELAGGRTDGAGAGAHPRAPAPGAALGGGAGSALAVQAGVESDGEEEEAVR